MNTMKPPKHGSQRRIIPSGTSNPNVPIHGRSARHAFVQGFQPGLIVVSRQYVQPDLRPENLRILRLHHYILQTGYVRNKGIELSLGYGHTWKKDLRWQTNFTLSHNKNKIIELVKNYVHPETGEILNKDRLDVGGLGKARFILKPGGTLGNIYTQADLKRDNNGMVKISPSGTITTESNLPDIKLGSVFPKCNLAWSNQFSWNGFSVSALFTARIGGIVYSATEAAMDEYGVSEVSALARDNGGVLINGRNMIAPQTYYTAIGSQSMPQYYTYSATNIRLQEASIGYTLPRKWLHNVCDIQVSVVGRNLGADYEPLSVDVNLSNTLFPCWFVVLLRLKVYLANATAAPHRRRRQAL